MALTCADDVLDTRLAGRLRHHLRPLPVYAVEGGPAPLADYGDQMHHRIDAAHGHLQARSIEDVAECQLHAVVGHDTGPGRTADKAAHRLSTSAQGFDHVPPKKAGCPCNQYHSAPREDDLI